MKRTVKTLLAAGVLSLFSFSAGCAKKGVDDQALANAIQAKLYSDALTRQAGVNVAVKDGVATLSGDVPSADVALEAVKVANSTEGIRGVNQELKITGPVAANSPAPETTPAPAATNPAPPANAPASPSRLTPAKPAAPSTASPVPGGEVATAPERPATKEPAHKQVEPATATIPAGTRLSVRTIDPIDSSKATLGQTFRASLDSPLISRGRVVVPAGADVNLTITSARSAGRVKGSSELALKASSLQYEGKTYRLATSDVSEVGKSRGKNTAMKTGIGAAAGALIGGLAGGGKGAAIGAAAGGGAGFGWNALTHGGQVKIPAETVLNFQLAEPLTLPANTRSE